MKQLMMTLFAMLALAIGLAMPAWAQMGFPTMR